MPLPLPLMALPLREVDLQGEMLPVVQRGAMVPMFRSAERATAAPVGLCAPLTKQV